MPKQTSASGEAALTVSRRELLIDGSDREFRRLVHNLFAFSARHEGIRNGHARAVGLAGVEYSVLISISHMSVSGPVNIRSVAEHLHVSGTFITRMVKVLERKGLVIKTVDEADRRRVNVVVTALGRTELNRLSVIQRQVNDVEFGPLSADEFAKLNDIIERLISSSETALALQDALAKKRQPDPDQSK
jgi:DNA-binding MarR family transcriptional regulator